MWQSSVIFLTENAQINKNQILRVVLCLLRVFLCLEILSFVYQWYHKLSPSGFVDFFNPVSSIHSCYTR